jgi:hypothetical protein
VLFDHERNHFFPLGLHHLRPSSNYLCSCAKKSAGMSAIVPDEQKESTINRVPTEMTPTSGFSRFFRQNGRSAGNDTNSTRWLSFIAPKVELSPVGAFRLKKTPFSWNNVLLNVGMVVLELMRLIRGSPVGFLVTTRNK